MQKKKIDAYSNNPNYICCVMEDMLFAEKRACMGKNIVDDYVWIISGNIWDKICNLSTCVIYAGPDSRVSYKIFNIEVEITDEVNAITLMRRNERRKEMPNHYYIDYSKFTRYYKKTPSTSVPTIKNVIFNEPATIVFWSDGTKTVVKCQDGESYDAEKGLAMAISKKALGNKGNYCNVFKKWLPEEEEKEKSTIIGKVVDCSITTDGATFTGELIMTPEREKKFRSWLLN